MRFIIHGVGAIGGAIAARLSQSGRDVAGIARGEQLEAIRNEGLLLRTPEGEYRARFPVAETPEKLGIRADDIIILAVKGQNTAGALADLRTAGVSEQAIVCAQNGVDNERMALRLFPNVYATTVVVAATYVRPGEIAAFNTPKSGIFDIGRYPTGHDATVDILVEALEASHFAVFPTDRPMRRKYGKLLGNLGNVLDAAAGEGGQKTPILADARAEAEAVYRAAGIEAEEPGGDDQRRRDELAQMGEVEGAERVGSSSSQSLVRGTGTIETDFLNGEIVLLGRLHGVPTPVNAALQALGHKLVADELRPGDMSKAEVEAFVRGWS